MGRERGQSHEVTHAGTARPISYGSQQQAAAAKGRQPAAGSEPHLRRRPRSPTTVSYFSGKRLTIVSWMQAACAASTTCRQAGGGHRKQAPQMDVGGAGQQVMFHCPQDTAVPHGHPGIHRHRARSQHGTAIYPAITRPPAHPPNLTSRPASQPASQPASRPASQPASQPASRPASRLASHPRSHSPPRRWRVAWHT